LLSNSEPKAPRFSLVNEYW